MGRWHVMLQQERKSGTSSEKDAALKVSTARDAQFKGSNQLQMELITLIRFS